MKSVFLLLSSVSALDHHILLLHRQTCPTDYKKAYRYHAEEKSEVYRLYLRLLLVTDYICGMTDSYAKRLYQELNAIMA